jgi:hypothetical protein
LRRRLRTIDNFGDWLGEIHEFVELRRPNRARTLYYGFNVPSIIVYMYSFNIVIYTLVLGPKIYATTERWLARYVVWDQVLPLTTLSFLDAQEPTTSNGTVWHWSRDASNG